MSVLSEGKTLGGGHYKNTNAKRPPNPPSPQQTSWISIKDRLPPDDTAVDIWTNEDERLTNYKFVKNYGGRRGNDFLNLLITGQHVLE